MRIDKLAKTLTDHLTLTATQDRFHVTPADQITSKDDKLIRQHKQELIHYLAFTCITCGLPAAVFDSHATPWCEQHMPTTDPAIRQALATLAQLQPAIVEEAS